MEEVAPPWTGTTGGSHIYRKDRYPCGSRWPRGARVAGIDGRAVVGGCGNGTSAKLCEPGGYPGALFNQQAEAFKNAGACTKYAAKGGQLAGVNSFPEPPSGSSFNATYSGFGLKPGTLASACVSYPGVGSDCMPFPEVEADGTFAAGPEGEFPCNIEGPKPAFLFVQAETAAGVLFTREFPPPSGC